MGQGGLSETLMMTQASSTWTASPVAFDQKGESLRFGDEMAREVALRAYRFLRRFIVDHLVPDADARIRRMLSMQPRARAVRMRQDPRAIDAWAVAIWSSDMEMAALCRLWTRQPIMSERQRISITLNRDAMGMAMDISLGHRPLLASQGEWLLWHATMALLRHRFGKARALAAGMAKAGYADLGEAMVGPSRLTVSGEVLSDGGVHFRVTGEVMSGLLQAAPSSLKAQRAAAASQEQHRVGEARARICAGPCLRFCWREGWSAGSATAPNVAAGVVVKRNRLFLKDRPAFIIFATPTGWCARTIHEPVEVHDSEPWTAIDTLRHAVVRYRDLLEGRASSESMPSVMREATVRQSPALEPQDRTSKTHTAYGPSRQPVDRPWGKSKAARERRARWLLSQTAANRS